ncbi:MAG TPA: TetR/AcrR family transcriptional regulator [Mycobacterium sp.]|nr:TetR/AcrR family transcriptional regulator [Mycobacterium sp.]
MTRQQQAQATRAAIIATARRLWGERGFFATSTSDIVNAAGVGTRGAFYAHFADREELFLAVFEDVHRSLAAQLDERIDTTADALESLQSVLIDFLDLVAVAPDVRALLVDGPAVFGPARWHRAEQARGLQPIEQRLRAAIEAGLVDEQPIGPLAQILLMLVNDTALMIAASDDPADARRDAGAALSRLVAGLRAPGRPRRAAAVRTQH